MTKLRRVSELSAHSPLSELVSEKGIMASHTGTKKAHMDTSSEKGIIARWRQPVA